VAKRRFQKGNFRLENGKWYTLYYEDSSEGTRRVRQLIGKAEEMSERAARREHDRIMQEVNRRRGSVPPAVKGQTFRDAVDSWRSAVAPNLSPATVRQRESYLRQHILPRFGDSAPHSLGVSALQPFATELRKKLSRKTVVNILGAVFTILDYARRCGTPVPKVKFSDLELGTETGESKAPFFTKEQAARIISASPEPYKTMFSVAWATGLRAGELLALTVGDLDFQQHTIRVNKSADDNTRAIRQPKTKNSVATLPMPTALASVLRRYLAQDWLPHPAGYLFPNRQGTHPRWRDNCVKYGLKPVLRRLGIPDHGAGLHAFRHGLATELANAGEPLPVLQQQMRHADVRTTLAVYAHAIPASQREAMERAAIGTNVPIGTETETQTVCA